MKALTAIEIPGLPVFTRGKVRNVYDLGDDLLVVASDRVSAFDHVLATGIPDKGKILTALSAWWFRRLEAVSRHHLVATEVERFPEVLRRHSDLLRDRSMLVRKARRIDLECIVRGYLAGSAWKEYSQSGTVSGLALEPGLKLNSRLDQAIFTPSTKADDGHDRNITVGEMYDLVGRETGEQLMARSLALFEAARKIAGSANITIVDTKFEFGRLGEDLILIDEIFTPDSSRFLFQEGGRGEPVNLDKQVIRDHLERSGWDKNPPAPGLPPEVVAEARRRYLLILESLTGEVPPWAQ